MERMRMETADLVRGNIEKIEKLFPNCITEEKTKDGFHKVVNFEMLRQMLSYDVTERDEKYEFTWVGKKAAVLEASRPIRKTLRPCPKESVDWDTTENLYIEGDNLEVLKLLQESYLNSVKMIYIDPPYNTGNDFIYRDDFAQSTGEYEENIGLYDEAENRMYKNTDVNGRFHSDWCTMIYSRLMLARNLLSEDGVIFISIDDNEFENLKKICDEVFGQANHCGTFVINSTPNARDYGHIGKMHEFCLFYAKDNTKATTNMLPETDKKFKYRDEKGAYNIHPLYNSNEAFNKYNRPNLYYPFYLYPDEPTGDGFFRIGFTKKDNCIEIYPPKSLKNQVQFVWRWGKDKAEKYMNEEITGYEVTKGEYRIVQKMRHNQKIIRSLLTDTKYSSRRGTAEVEEILGGKIFPFPKPTGLIHDFAKVGLMKDDIILDFFSGSGTTAQAVMELNAEDHGRRKFILVQMPEQIAKESDAYKAGYRNICEIGKERICRAGEKIIKETGTDIDKGFRVLKLDESNMNDIYYSADEYNQDMLSMLESNVKSDRTDLDLLFGCLLEWGLPLSMPYRSEEIGTCKVHTYNDKELIVCFDDNIPENVIKVIAERQPRRAVFRDSGFTSSSSKINVNEIFKLYSPDTRVKVI